MLLFEGVRDVLEEHQAEHDVLVLGRVHVIAQRSASAAAQSFCSKPTVAGVCDVLFAFLVLGTQADSIFMISPTC